MVDEAVAYESWVNSDTIIDGQNVGSSWDVCQVGEVFLPGVVTIDGLEIGRDIDIQKKKKKECARIRDNGLSPIAFDIICEITGKQWADWLKVRPYIQPKKGGIRTPLSVVHPLVNSHEVDTIYVHRIKIDPPSPRKGMKITIKVGEWFEDEVEAKGASKKVPASLQAAYGKPDYFGDPNTLAKQLASNAGFVEPGNDIDNVMKNAYEAQ